MRSYPLRFRIWDAKRNEWYCESNPDALTYYGFGMFGECTLPQRINTADLPHLIVEQFIGITDKNGTDVYTGDIVETDGMEINGQKSRDVVQLTHGVYEPAAFFTEESLEVIGNVHEQPELLKERNTK